MVTTDSPSAFWAVIEHHRIWWGADGPIRHKIALDGTLLNDVAAVTGKIDVRGAMMVD